MPNTCAVSQTPAGQMIIEPSTAKLQATSLSANISVDEKHTSKAQKAVAQAVDNEVLVCNITAFLEDYGPSPAIARANVDRCKDCIRELGVLGGSEWEGFPTLPSESRKTGLEAFAPLENIVRGIWEFAEEKEKKKRNQYDFKMAPHDHPHDTVGELDLKMGACIVEATCEEKLLNDCIVVPFGLKTGRGEPEQTQVCEMVVGDCHQILCDDPRRMFIFGVAVENNLFSIWYFSRSRSVKSLAINWKDKGMDDFIRVILAFAYATPQELGLDPIILKAPRLASDEIQEYVYEFELTEDSTNSLPIHGSLNTRTSAADDPWKRHAGIYYRTVRGRVPIRPVRISGRTTRVWEVVQVASTKALPEDGVEHIILKDVWLDANSITEAENQTLIFQAVDGYMEKGLKAHTGPDSMMEFINCEARFKDFNDNTKRRLAGLLTNKEYKNLFFTKILEWKGQLTKKRSDAASSPFSSLSTLSSAKGKEVDSSRDPQTDPNTSMVARSDITSTVPQSPAVVARGQYDQKRQVRFVYKGACNEISKLPIFGDVLDVIRQAIDALQVLYCAGWVHRDISIGSILAVAAVNEAGETTGWKVKLADLEFSQRFGHSNNNTDSRTGTPFFMPVEIMKREHLAMQFRAPQAMRLAATLAGHFKLQPEHPDYKHYLKYRKNNIMDAYKNPPADATAEHNCPNHVTHNYQHDLESIWWMILYFITACADESDSEDYAKTIFLRKLEAAPREAVLEHFIDSVLERKLHVLLKGPFHGPMESLRATLHENYIKRVIFGQTKVHESYSNIHGQFAEQLDLILDDEDDEWKNLPVSKMTRTVTTGDTLSCLLDTQSTGVRRMQDPVLLSSNEQDLAE